MPLPRKPAITNTRADVDALLAGEEHFGSYRVLGNLTISYDVPDTADYKRTLDLETGLYTTEFSAGGAKFDTEVFCSYPDAVCVYQISSDGALPPISIALENQLVDQDLLEITCGEGYARLTGVTQRGPPQGLKYDAIVRLSDHSKGKSTCSDGVLVITPAKNEKSVTVVIGAGTDYDQSKGDAASNFSFQGPDPAEAVEKATSDGAAEKPKTLLKRHQKDYRSLASAFSLDLPDPNESANEETAPLLAGYDPFGAGDPFVEALLFDYSRYLLISSSRENSLPANLQGRWAEEIGPAWNGDYHININLQMNYWAADQTGLWATEPALWNYMRQTLVPRGEETARLLYNASGWVTHHGSNIFGYTAMGSEAGWANCES
ncbi:glycoside hydrolase N-terminal domain-containing protein [Candidatus Bathyarchaeota archaeon]|nr:glycoside hydrolase N-terminal domain-containing protein [Candidatus Bathyarchaeota archaeon]